MNTPSDRVQLRDSGSLRHPGNCALCGSATCVDGYVDLDIYFEYEGNIYLCMNCVKQICKVVGALLPDESEHLANLNNEIATECAKLRVELDDYRNLRELIDRISDGGLSLTVTGSGNPVDPAPEQSEQSKQPDSSSTPVGTDARKPVAKKSTSGQRPNDASQSQRSNTTGLNI